MTVGTIYSRTGFESRVQIDKILTHDVKDCKKVKLDKPVYHIKYIDENKPPFTCYARDVSNMVGLGRWVQQK